MSFKPDIPETSVYKSKPITSKQYSQQSEVKKGKNFDNKEDLMLAVRGTNLVAVAMDGNNQIVPIAFGICKGEIGPCWTCMSKLQMLQPDAYQKLCDAGLQRWSRAHCPLVRYNYMKSNSIESVNAKSVIHRKEHVLKLAETYRAMVQEWYYKRQQLAENMTYEITDWAAHKVAKKV
nr:transposase, MuDR, MULE transposase domain protein [Tanacetum cinerariifolium]